MSTPSQNGQNVSAHAKSILSASSLIAGATLVSRVLGFARDLMIAYLLGAGPWADAFFVAFRAPNLMRRLFGEGTLAMAFVPRYTRLSHEQGPEKAHALARASLFWLLVIIGSCVGLGMLFAPEVTALLAPGFVGDPPLFELTVSLVLLCWPYALFACGLALCMGVLNAERHFLAPALAPCVLNISLLTAGGAAILFDLSPPHALAWGVLAGGACQWLTQQPALRSVGFSWRGAWKVRDPEVKGLARDMLPTVFGAAAYQINILLGTLLASFLPGGAISYLYYADRLVQFPLGVFGIALSVAALPSLSALAAENRLADMDAVLARTMRLMLYICLPSAAGLIALANPIVSLLFERGAFAPEAVSQTALVLSGYSLGLPAFALIRPLAGAFYARQDTKTPALAAGASVLCFVALAVPLLSPLEHFGLALATSAASWCNVLTLQIALRRALGPRESSARIKKSVMCYLALSLVVGVCAWAPGAMFPHSRALPVLLIPLWGALYLWGTHRMGFEDATMLLDTVVRRKK